MAKWTVFVQRRKPFSESGWGEWEESIVINAVNEDEAMIKARADAPEEMVKMKVERVLAERPVGRPGRYDGQEAPPQAMVNLTIQVPALLHKAIKRLAFEGETTMREIIIDLLEKKLKEGEKNG